MQVLGEYFVLLPEQHLSIRGVQGTGSDERGTDRNLFNSGRAASAGEQRAPQLPLYVPVDRHP